MPFPSRAFPFIFLALAGLTSCRPLANHQVASQKISSPSRASPPPASTPRPSATPPPVVEQIADRSPVAPPLFSSSTVAGIRFDGAGFDSRSHRLRVIDQAGGPGSSYDSSASVARDTDALLAINAGFFTPEGDPLGLVISRGKSSGAWNSASSLGTGIYLEKSSAPPAIRRRTSKSAVSSASELLQAGPLLVENGSSVQGLDSSKSALRSILLSDGKFRWWIGKTSPCTLSALAAALADSSPATFQPQSALNLDGGRSTDLYVAPSVPGGPFEARTFLNRPVRNFLILTPR